MVKSSCGPFSVTQCYGPPKSVALPERERNSTRLVPVTSPKGICAKGLRNVYEPGTGIGQERVIISVSSQLPSTINTTINLLRLLRKTYMSICFIRHT